MILPDEFWSRTRNIQRIHQHRYASGKDWVVGWIILLLEHAGRMNWHPLMMGLMMRMHRLPIRPGDTRLEDLSGKLALVILHPET